MGHIKSIEPESGTSFSFNFKEKFSVTAAPVLLPTLLKRKLHHELPFFVPFPLFYPFRTGDDPLVKGR
ncbi:hypothetical protein NC99_05200 [Sunxiuqinia dokdonensis]|uniref:Uncharacterized protein n=1 Tax=Sunxiuqinia dokdonensis TaxID=1409788 RepID=A0A0L8VDY9_9BACT|nr:hypothetical protein NC99_05200 [Sunxiuqinia dokdonensis]